MSTEPLFVALGQFRKSWVTHGWSWDRRFECLASTFAVTRVSDATDAIRAVFPNEFTADTLGRAPEAILEVADATGGVRADQRVYATNEFASLISYALWWPWGGDGATNISLRVGLAGSPSFDDVIRLREMFGALDD